METALRMRNKIFVLFLVLCVQFALGQFQKGKKSRIDYKIAFDIDFFFTDLGV